MKKSFCAVVAFMIAVTCMLTGCMNNDPFDSSMVINYSRLYGVQDLGAGANVTTAINSFNNKREPSAFYSSKDKAEAESLYKNYINKNNWYPEASGLNAMTVITAKDTIVSLRYDTKLSVMYFDEKSNAKTYFDALAASLKNGEIKTGFKDGYEYAILYKTSADRSGNIDFLEGVYLRGNSVLLCSGFSPIGGVDTFSDVIYGKIGLIDPITLKKK